MAVFTVVRSFRSVWQLSLASLGLVSVLTAVFPASAQLRDPASQMPPPEQTEGLNELRPLNQSSNRFSIATGERLMAEADAAIAEQDYATATTKLNEARDIFNDMSTYYQELSAMFLGISTPINQAHRDKALETAQLRDQASYQLALVYRAQNQPDEAVPLLMEILRSQQPTRELGQRAYQQLFELGFVDEPYTGSATSSSGSAEN